MYNIKEITSFLSDINEKCIKQKKINTISYPTIVDKTESFNYFSNEVDIWGHS